MIKWINSVHQTSLKPTWKTLVLVLRLIDLDHLAEEINMCLSGGTVKQLSEGTSTSKEQDSKRGNDRCDMLYSYSIATMSTSCSVTQSFIQCPRISHPLAQLFSLLLQALLTLLHVYFVILPNLNITRAFSM